MSLKVPRFLLCALLAGAIVPPVARADVELPAVPVPAADSLMATAHTLAVARWGVDPCGGQVNVTWAHMGAGINARSQWMSTDVHDASTYSDCSISYNLDVDWDWPKLCTVVEHELGHLSGHDHVNDPHDVMSPYYVYPTSECAAGTAAAAPAAPTADPAPVHASSVPKKAAKRKSTKTAAARKAAARRAAKARAAKARAAKGRAAKARAAKARSAQRRAAGGASA